VEIIGLHTTEKVKECVTKKLASFDVSFEDIFAIVTDNGSNVVKAFNEYHGKFNFLSTSLIRILGTNEEEEEEPESDEIDQLNIDEDDPAEPTFSKLTGRRYSCAAHNLQLCLFHAIRSTMGASNAFKRLLKFQNSFAHSLSSRSELKRRGKMYKAVFRVRWGSWIDVVTRYIEIKDNMVQVSLTYSIYIKFVIFRLPALILLLRVAF